MLIDREQIHSLINTMDDVENHIRIPRDHGAIRCTPHDRRDRAPDRSEPEMLRTPA
jgi:hypothetical protein